MADLDLITLADVQTFLPTADVIKTPLIITAVSRLVESCLGYCLKYEEKTERVCSRGGQYLALPRYPLDTVTLIECEGVEVEDWEQYENGDRWGWVFKDWGWPAECRHLPLVNYSAIASSYLDVTYSAGYQLPTQASGPLLPQDLKMLVIELVINRLIGRNAELIAGGRVATEENVGALRVKFSTSTSGSSGTPAFAMEEKLLADIKRSHRRPDVPC